MTYDLDEYLRLTAAALAGPIGRAWLTAAIARAQAEPSYQPGDAFDAVAFRLGRKDALAQIARDLARATRPVSLKE